MRIPLGKSSYNTISVMQSCVKDFLGEKMVRFFSSVIKAEILPISNCALYHSIYVVFPSFVG